MWYYKKDGNIIGPASARKIASMRKLGIITDSTPVSKKKNAKNWDTFGDLSEKIILESSQWDRQSRVRSGLAKNAMLLRALLVSTIAVMCVLIFYTLQNYNFLCEYISGVEENNEIFFDIEVSTSVDTRNFANIMLLAMLAASFLQSLKWAKSAFLSAYALSPSFRLSFSSENSYRWFIFRPFKILRKIYYAASDKLGKRVSLGDKIFFFALQFLSILYLALILVNNINYIYLNSFNLSSAKTAYFYLVYTQFVGICAAALWIICITKIETSLHTAKIRHRHHSHT